MSLWSFPYADTINEPLVDKRVCAKCKKEKLLTDFSPAHYRCKECRREDSKIRYLHNLSIEQYQELLISQGGRCAICGKVPEEVYKFVIDHDHTCCPGPISCGDCIRGLLCNKCNSGLGMFDDNLKNVLSAAEYLQRTS
jgi:hypothetical protein